MIFTAAPRARFCLRRTARDFSLTVAAHHGLQNPHPPGTARPPRHRLAAKQALLGFDGFVDTIVTPVAMRAGQGENFTPIGTITEFGQRILGAAGKSTNVEFYPRMDKLGGNGPIMANALLAHGAPVTYIGALGRTTIHPVFAEFRSNARQGGFALRPRPATTAVECPDGKIMLGMMRSLDEITPAADYRRSHGATDAYRAALGAADLVGRP